MTNEMEMEKGATMLRVYLPAGQWTDLWTELALQGGREIDQPVDLATMPLYVTVRMSGSNRGIPVTFSSTPVEVRL